MKNPFPLTSYELQSEGHNAHQCQQDEANEKQPQKIVGNQNKRNSLLWEVLLSIFLIIFLVLSFSPFHPFTSLFFFGLRALCSFGSQGVYINLLSTEWVN